MMSSGRHRLMFDQGGNTLKSGQAALAVLRALHVVDSEVGLRTFERSAGVTRFGAKLDPSLSHPKSPDSQVRQPPANDSTYSGGPVSRAIKFEKQHVLASPQSRVNLKRTTAVLARSISSSEAAPCRRLDPFRESLSSPYSIARVGANDHG
jgi:hypothetical protein